MAYVERQRGGRHLVPMRERYEGERWTAVCRLDDIEPGRGVVRIVNGTEVALMRNGDTVYGLGNLCPHRGGQIGDGHVEDGKAICPLHAWDFDLETGISPFNPADMLPTYPVRVQNGEVEIDADGVPHAPARPMTYLGEWTRRGATDRGMYLVHHLAEGGGPFVEAMGSERNEPGLHARPFPSYDDIVFRPAQLDPPAAARRRAGRHGGRPGIAGGAPASPRHPAVREPHVLRRAQPGRQGGAGAGSVGRGNGDRERRGRCAPARAEPRRALHLRDGVRLLWVERRERPGSLGHRGEDRPGSEARAGRNASRLEGDGGDRRGARRDPRYRCSLAGPLPDIASARELAARVAEIKDQTGGVPVGVKFAAGDVERDVAAALECGADYITIDGLGGGTGAAPVHVKDHVGIPSAFGLYRARRFLDDQGVTDVQLVATGGFRTPDEMAKALALGADAVALATASLMAIGCQQYRACHSDGCPVGIATQNPRLRGRLDVEESARRLTQFLTGATAMMVDYARICGRDSLGRLERSDLATLDPELARRTDLEWVV
jgi:nitrite reductase/ring-hydroxylating ferredoxin subunit